MFIPSHERQKILRYIFQEGVILVEDTNIGVHSGTGVNNLFCKSITRSLTDKGWLVKTFVMRHGYYRLTEEGIEALKEYLCVPENYMPITHSGEFIKDLSIEGEKQSL